MTNISLLQEALANGMIDITTIRQQVDMKKREQQLQQFKIWQGANDYWYAYLPDETKKSKRRLVKKRKRKDLEDYLIGETYGEEAVEPEQATIRSLYPKWLKWKANRTGRSL